MKILIIEDEKSSANRLCRMLGEIHEVETELITIVTSNKEAEEFFVSNNIKPDLILSDIQLGDGLSFQSLSKAGPDIPVIFTTAYEQYALNAFNYNGIAYILKPIDKQELTEALLKVNARTNCAVSAIDKLSDTHQLQSILSALQNSGIRYRERFLISFRNELKVIPVTEVSHISLIEGSTFLFTKLGKQYSLSQTLEELETQLTPALFMRVNRQYIVCIDAVESMVANFLGKMQLRLHNYSNTKIIISRAKVPMVKKWLDS